MNIEVELQKEKEIQNRRSGQVADHLIQTVSEILLQEEQTETEILSRLKSREHEASEPFSAVPDPTRVYSEKHIETVCIKYRLRFLPSGMFKNEFPADAVFAVKRFEEATGRKVTSFRLIAPGSVFQLEDRDKDPLLFAEIGNGNYYLLHKWGNDLKSIRKVLTYPLRDVYTLFGVLLCVAALLAAVIPTSWIIRFEDDPEKIFFYRLGFLVHIFIAMFFTVVYLGLAFRKNLSSMQWKSRYFN